MAETSYDFNGSVTLVTGANGNLGRAVARAFAAAGAELVLVGRTRERVVEALPELAGRSGVFVAPSTDLADEMAVAAMVEKALETFPGIDVLANTVGGYRGGTPLSGTSTADWSRMFLLNATTAFQVSKAVIPHMIERGHGRIIHTASRAALGGARNAAAYAAAKAGVVALTDSLSKELKRRCINVNCILPGTIDTPQNREAMPSADLGQWVSPASVAGVFLFLASDAAEDIHGAHLPVYGLG